MLIKLPKINGLKLLQPIQKTNHINFRSSSSREIITLHLKKSTLLATKRSLKLEKVFFSTDNQNKNSNEPRIKQYQRHLGNFFEHLFLKADSRKIHNEHREKFKQDLEKQIENEIKKIDLRLETKEESYLSELDKKQKEKSSEHITDFTKKLVIKKDDSIDFFKKGFEKECDEVIRIKKEHIDKDLELKTTKIINDKQTTFANTLRIKSREIELLLNSLEEQLSNKADMLIEEIEQEELPDLVKMELKKQITEGKHELTKFIENLRKIEESKFLKISDQITTNIDKATSVFSVLFKEEIGNLTATIDKAKSEREALNKETNKSVRKRIRNMLLGYGSLLFLITLLLMLLDLYEGEEYQKISEQIIDSLFTFDSAMSRINNDFIRRLKKEVNSQPNSLFSKWTPFLLKVRFLTLAFAANSIEKNRDLAVALLLLLHSDYVNAIELLEEIKEKYNGPAITYLGLSIGFQHLGNMDGAIASLKLAKERKDMAWTPYRRNLLGIQIEIQSAMLQIASGQKNQAVQTLNEALKLISISKNPEEFELYRLIANRELTKLNMENGNNETIYDSLKEKLRDMQNSKRYEFLYEKSRKILHIYNSMKIPNNPELEDFLKLQSKILEAQLDFINKKFKNSQERQSCELKINELINLHGKDNRIYDLLTNLAELIKSDELKASPARAGITSHYEYGLMSSIAYYGQLSAAKKDKQYKFLEEKEWKGITDSKGLDLEKGGFSAIAFYNEARHEIVVAFRGTYNIQNILTDLNSYYYSEQHVIFEYACEMLKRTETEFEKTYNIDKDGYKPRLVFVGHSMGAWLAECTLWKKILNPKNSKFSYSYLEAITFESPGSRNLIDKMKKHMPGAVKFTEPEMITYVTSPDIVNTAKEHAGTVIQVNATDYTVNPFYWLILAIASPFLSLYAAIRYEFRFVYPRQWIQAFSAHPISNILRGFDENTGSPRTADTENNNTYSSFPLRAKSWPLGLSEHAHYLKIEKRGKTKEKNLDWQIEERHKLTTVANYNVEQMNLFKAHKSMFSHQIWTYLQNYLLSNGELDPKADYTVMRYTITEDTLHIHSGLTTTQLKRYAEDRMVIPENLDKFSNYREIGFFGERKATIAIKRISTATATLANNQPLGMVIRNT